ncbi:DUF7260 family protein [Halegenticoccus soli]|uniref:DUF7260 family protein n=1 Tax=Halegenticoccus soli TaxID=1985678 RepID=UPI00117A5282|nr:hypothetical protein [Halegenticoccus soli]
MLGNMYLAGKLPVTGSKVSTHSCSVTAGCAGLELLEILRILFWIAVFCILVIGMLSSIPAARALVAEERGRTNDERQAFEAFIQRVKSLSPAESSPSPGGIQIRTEDTQDRDGLEPVRQAYRETVMATPHYNDDYDESLETNLREEFSDEIAVAVVESGDFTPQLKRALVEKGIKSRKERKMLLQALDAEADELEAAQQLLRRIVRTCEAIQSRQLELRSYDELTSTWQRLDSLEANCIDCLYDRQQSIHDGHVLGHRRANSDTIHAYLYGDLDETYPILADGTRVFELVQDIKREITQLITTKD